MWSLINNRERLHSNKVTEIKMVNSVQAQFILFEGMKAECVTECPYSKGTAEFKMWMDCYFLKIKTQQRISRRRRNAV